MNNVKQKPLIAHVIHRFGVGGLENGLVNLINNLPIDDYDHAIVCLTESTAFSKRLKRNDVEIYELHKKDGKDLGFYVRLWKLLRHIKPDIVHSRNLAALESSVVAKFAGVPIRIHGEHGRDIYDLDGKNRKYQYLRKFCSYFIDVFITMSIDLENWLVNEVGISPRKVVQLYNGVDIDKFQPSNQIKSVRHHLPEGFAQDGCIVIGTVGRLEPVKDQLTLVKAFVKLLEMAPDFSEKLRLVLIGDGSLKGQIELLAKTTGIIDKIWLAGSCDEVPSILNEFDIFVLPSLGEGISNTILEAMSCELPVVATAVGGNVELVKNGLTGTLVPENNPAAMASALQAYLANSSMRITQGKNGRQLVDETFSLSAMIRRYKSVYDPLLKNNRLIT